MTIGLFRAAFFDIDDTLYPTHRFVWEGRRRAVEAMVQAGLRADVEDLLERLRGIVEQVGSNASNHFDLLLAVLPADAYAPVNPAVIVASAIAAYHWHKAHDLFPFEDTATFLDWLKGRGVRLGVITAGAPVKQAEKLVRLRLLDYFEPSLIFIAEQAGFDKKGSDLYRHALGKAGVAAGEALYIGDHPVRDIDAANAAGLVTVLMNRAGHYAGVAGRTQPRYRVGNFLELMDILARETDRSPEPGDRRLGN